MTVICRATYDLVAGQARLAAVQDYPNEEENHWNDDPARPAPLASYDPAERDAWLEAHGVKVLRFWNSRLRRERQTIRDTIWRTLQERAPHPLPAYCEPGICTSNQLSAGANA